MADRPPATRLPAHGIDADPVLAAMAGLRADDRDWRGGRVFSLVYSAGDDVHDLLERAATLYSAENALNTMVFPSLGRMQQDIVTITTGLLGGDRLPAADAGGVRGYLTSGGTESLLQATKTARDWGRDRHGIDQPNMVLATSAHAAFEKAAHYFDVESRRVAGAAGLLGRRRRHGRRRRRRDRAGGGVGPLLPPGRHRPDGRAGRHGRRARHPVPRRRLPRRLPPPLPRTASVT